MNHSTLVNIGKHDFLAVFAGSELRMAPGRHELFFNAFNKPRLAAIRTNFG